MGINLETKLKFPKGFLLGAASSAHQVEGANTNNDWWHYEEEGKVPKSGAATDHYNRFDEDFSLASKIGLNSMRVSIEWARIEPEEGRWDMQAVEHYRKVFQSMKEHGLTPTVTLHHFTLPWWLAKRGGFSSLTTPKLFARYAAFIVKQFNHEVKLWITINEPQIYILLTHVWGTHPPFKKNIFSAIWLEHQLIVSHRLAYRAIKKVTASAQVGIAKNNVYNEPYRKNNFFDNLVVNVSKYFGNHYFLNSISSETDFIGLNYYFSHVVRWSWKKGYENISTTEPRSDMGWRTFPEGLYYLLQDLTKYKKPIYITENGIANATDDMRKRYIYEHLWWTKKAQGEGVDVRGYFYWTLVDNYEWHDGFDPKFGLIELNNQTLERRIRQSADIFKQIQIEHD